MHVPQYVHEKYAYKKNPFKSKISVIQTPVKRQDRLIFSQEGKYSGVWE